MSLQLQTCLIWAQLLCPKSGGGAGGGGGGGGGGQVNRVLDALRRLTASKPYNTYSRTSIIQTPIIQNSL